MERVLSRRPGGDPRAYGNRGIAQVVLGNFDAGMADLDKAIELDPTDAMFWNNRSYTHLKIGEVDAAMADVNRAIELDPLFALPYGNRAKAYT